MDFILVSQRNAPSVPFWGENEPRTGPSPLHCLSDRLTWPFLSLNPLVFSPLSLLSQPGGRPEAILKGKRS